MRPPGRHLIIGAASLALAAGSGYLTAQAVGAGAPPAKTVTVDVGTGERGPIGPPGPPGPTGPAGGVECPDGFTLSNVVFNAPGGHQTTIVACVKD